MAQQHVHQWDIDPPHGKTSIGRCACGAEREFHNYIELGNAGWNSMQVKSQRSQDVEEEWKARRERAFGYMALNPDD